MPSAAKLIVEKNLDINAVIGTGVDGRVTKGDVLLHLNLIKNKTIEEETSKPQKNILKRKSLEERFPEERKIKVNSVN